MNNRFAVALNTLDRLQTAADSFSALDIKEEIKVIKEAFTLQQLKELKEKTTLEQDEQKQLSALQAKKLNPQDTSKKLRARLFDDNSRFDNIELSGLNSTDEKTRYREIDNGLLLLGQYFPANFADVNTDTIIKCPLTNEKILPEKPRFVTSKGIQLSLEGIIEYAKAEKYNLQIINIADGEEFIREIFIEDASTSNTPALISLGDMFYLCGEYNGEWAIRLIANDDQAFFNRANLKQDILDDDSPEFTDEMRSIVQKYHHHSPTRIETLVGAGKQYIILTDRDKDRLELFLLNERQRDSRITSTKLGLAAGSLTTPIAILACGYFAIPLGTLLSLTCTTVAPLLVLGVIGAVVGHYKASPGNRGKELKEQIGDVVGNMPFQNMSKPTGTQWCNFGFANSIRDFADSSLFKSCRSAPSSP